MRWKIQLKRNLTEVNLLLALWALWHFVAAACVSCVWRRKSRSCGWRETAAVRDEPTCYI